MTIQELAQQYANLFVTGTRPNGDKYLYIEEENESLHDLIHQAHGGMMPDDYAYQFIYESLEAIAETSDPDNIHFEADVYYSDLLKWVSSRISRPDYVDSVVQDCGYEGFFGSLMMAQVREKEEILASVRVSLETLCEEMNNA